MMPAPRLTFSTGSLYLYGLERVFALAAEFGFDGVEVMCDERLDTRQPGYLRHLSETYHLPITSLHAPFVTARLPGWTPGLVAAVRQTVALAEQVGAEHVVVHVPRKVGYLVVQGTRTWRLPWVAIDGEIRQWIAEGELARFQAETAVQVCLENMPILARRLNGLIPDRYLTWWNTVEAWSQVHDHLTLDTTHWATHRIDPLAAYRAAGKRVRHIHLSNFHDGQEHQLPHRGDLDLVGFLRSVIADGFDGHMVLELDPRSLEAVDESKLRQNLAASAAFCRAAMGREA